MYNFSQVTFFINVVYNFQPSIQDARARFVSTKISEVVPYAEVYKELPYFLKRNKQAKDKNTSGFWVNVYAL